MPINFGQLKIKVEKSVNFSEQPTLAREKSRTLECMVVVGSYGQDMVLSYKMSYGEAL